MVGKTGPHLENGRCGLVEFQKPRLDGGDIVEDYDITVEIASKSTVYTSTGGN
jgi:hypothetical protein